MNYKIIIFLLLTVGFFSSCEYKFNDENYINLEKPESPDYYFKIKAPQDENGNYLIHYNYVPYETNIPKNLIKDGTYILGYYSNNNFTSYNYYSFYKDQSYIYVPTSNHFDYNRIRISIYSTEKGDDLAYIINDNRRCYKFDIPVIFQEKSPTLNLRYENQSDGSIKIIWDEIDPFYGTVDYYEICYCWGDWNDIKKTTNNTFFVIEKDIYENCYGIQVCAHFKEGYLDSFCKYLD